MPEPVVTAIAPTRHSPRILPFVVGGLAIVVVGFLVGLALPNAGADDEQPVDTSALPDVIVPPSISIPPATSEESVPELTIPVSEQLFNVTAPPPGYVETANISRSGPDRVEQQVVLRGDDDEILIFGYTAADLIELPSGDPVQVRGVDGVISEAPDGTLVLTWIEPGQILMTIHASPSFGEDGMTLLASLLEFT